MMADGQMDFPKPFIWNEEFTAEVAERTQGIYFSECPICWQHPAQSISITEKVRCALVASPFSRPIIVPGLKYS